MAPAPAPDPAAETATATLVLLTMILVRLPGEQQGGVGVQLHGGGGGVQQGGGAGGVQQGGGAGGEQQTCALAVCGAPATSSRSNSPPARARDILVSALIGMAFAPCT